jgi:UDP-N-acetylglucosamine--N-acetylmuramyl-(pentapeptide) pyrophosphoryl-undecaprenol N-acetylglucosamine transferase
VEAAVAMKVVVTGAGSGGHITPVLVVARELKLIQPSIEIIYIGHKGDSLADIPARDKNIDHVYNVRAGKLRRYHGEGLRQLLDLPTVIKNIRDMLFVVIGIWQSYWLLRKLRPNAVFVKGGFVGIPVGLAAAALHIPYLTHDSDALPGLANRVIAPWARLHAVGLPKEVYDYPPEKTITVGVPHAPEFHPLNSKEVYQLREKLGLGHYKKMVFITGGGLGAQRINKAVLACAPDLLKRYSDLVIVHVTGRKDESSIAQAYKMVLPTKEQRRVVTKGFITDLYSYSGAADVIITRAGATAMAEFASQAKPCVVIPNPLLAGGHQLHNAQVLDETKTVRMVSETDLAADPMTLMAPVVDLLDHPDRAHELGKKLSKLSRPDAAHQLAMLLLEIAGGARSISLS